MPARPHRFGHTAGARLPANLPPQSGQSRGNALQVVNPQGQVGEAEPVHGTTLAGTDMTRVFEIHQLNAHAVTLDEQAFELHIIDLTQFGAGIHVGGKAGDGFEPQSLTVKRRRALEV